MLVWSVSTQLQEGFLELKGESSKEATITFNRSPVQGTNDGVIGEFMFENATDSVALLSVKRESAADDAYFQFATQASGGGMTERLRIGSSGQIGLSGANYGTSGQVLTSNGSGSAPTVSGRTLEHPPLLLKQKQKQEQTTQT